MLTETSPVTSETDKDKMLMTHCVGEGLGREQWTAWSSLPEFWHQAQMDMTPVMHTGSAGRNGCEGDTPTSLLGTMGISQCCRTEQCHLSSPKSPRWEYYHHGNQEVPRSSSESQLITTYKFWNLGQFDIFMVVCGVPVQFLKIMRLNIWVIWNFVCHFSGGGLVLLYK
jgi:hypothetical protein